MPKMSKLPKMPKMKKGSKFFGHRLAQIFTDLVKIGF
jgi:hypothetical protein